MRDALPKASFIGFTGTPIESGDKHTQAVFGDYIDVYDILQSNEYKATVPIDYEARLAKIDLKPEERPKIDPNFGEVTEDAEESTKETRHRKWRNWMRCSGRTSASRWWPKIWGSIGKRVTTRWKARRWWSA
jgi:type I restriction enzyme R subunit